MHVETVDKIDLNFFYCVFSFETYYLIAFSGSIH